MNNNQAVFGVAIIIVAVAVLLSNMNISFARELVSSWWPLLLVGLGLYMLWNDRSNLAWSLIVTSVGVGLLISTLGVLGLSFGDVFVPIVLLGIGVAVLTGANRSGLAHNSQSSDNEEAVWAIFGGASSRNDSNDYRGGAANAVLGGVDLDLSKVEIKSEAVLQVWVLMGGVTVRIPEGVTVKQRTMNIMGSTEDKTTSRKGKDSAVLYIDGTVTMGSVEIKY